MFDIIPQGDATIEMGGCGGHSKNPPLPPGGGGGGDLVSTMPGCVCREVKDMGPFLDSSD